MKSEQHLNNMKKAAGFFAQAHQQGERKEFNKAIELYMQGLEHAPDAVQQGHIELREMALLRQMEGAEPPTEQQKQRLERARNPKERMLAAEYLLSKDPGHTAYAEAMLESAIAAGFRRTANWIADLIFLANNNAKNPSPRLYMVLAEAYESIERYDRAIAAGKWALKTKPDSDKIKHLLNRLAANFKQHQQTGEQLGRSGTFDALDSQSGVSAVQGKESEIKQRERDDMAKQIDPTTEKALAFFSKGIKVAQTGNYDYAIDLFIDGLRCTPDAVQDGHVKLRELALARQVKGGKKPSMSERMKRMRGKTPLEQMINAEYLFSKDPDHLPYGEAMLKGAISGGFTRTAKWIADLIFQANNASEKKSFSTYILLKDAYTNLELYDHALAACQWALKLKPKDGDLAEEYKNLSAELAVSRGKYDQEGDFRKSIKDREAQELLHAQEGMVKSEDQRMTVVKAARKQYKDNPTSVQNVMNLVDVLVDQQTEEADEEATKVLESAYQKTREFNFKQKQGEVRIKSIKRRLRQTRSAAMADPADESAKSLVGKLANQLLKAELEYYRRCSEHNPTDLNLKYEYGIRLMQNKQYDEAIPQFQQSQHNPRRRISSMNNIGKCFLMKAWVDDAIDVLLQAIESYENDQDVIGKEMRYNLARSYEQKGEKDQALDIYRKIAQIDFNYKDVRQRVAKLRQGT